MKGALQIVIIITIIIIYLFIFILITKCRSGYWTNAMLKLGIKLEAEILSALLAPTMFVREQGWNQCC